MVEVEVNVETCIEKDLKMNNLSIPDFEKNDSDVSEEDEDRGRTEQNLFFSNTKDITYIRGKTISHERYPLKNALKHLQII
ncbi:hypothetical protein PVAND_011712 [Polypedilum vanderplanki]|uniref:Uncharacterized protein n=1 Tax=Polypedilum vanderplanki TaxID=319348 RepID=A0A9J6CL17_POLVA|nr:hypothetical protein PVAND_011712 [Polypedilum vanderplanki]